jgi:hypothetical protein
MKEFNMKYLLIILIIFSTSGCYNFSQAPFKESDLILMEDTKFGQKIKERMDSLPQNRTKTYMSGNKETYVLEVSDKLLIEQKFEDGQWSIVTYLTYPDAFFVCTFMNDIIDEKMISIYDVKTKNIEDGMIPSKLISGSQESLEKLVVELSQNSPKICILMPLTKLLKE